MEENILLAPPGNSLSTRLLLFLLCLGLTTALFSASIERQVTKEIVALACLDITITSSCIYWYGKAFLITTRSQILAFCRRYGLKSVLMYFFFLSVSYVVLTYIVSIGYAQTARAFTTVEEHLGDFLVEPDVTRPVALKPIRNSEEEQSSYPQSQIRYPGEDVVFHCQRICYYSSDVIPCADDFNVEWEKNGQMFTLSDKKSITWSFEDKALPHDQKKKYLITSSLSLLLINEKDFATYTCQMQQLSNYIIPEESSTDRELVSIFRLMQMQEKIHTVYVPPGGLIYITAFYYSEAEFEDLSFEYTIGGQSYEYICGEMPGRTLTIPTVYWRYFQNGGHDWYYMFTQGFDVNAGKGTILYKWQSVCKHAYAVHEVSFYRKFFNINSGLYELHKFTYPYKLHVVPKVPNFLYLVFPKCFLDAFKPDQCLITNEIDGKCERETVLDCSFRFLIKFEELFLIAVTIIGFIATTSMINIFTFIFFKVKNRILKGLFNPCVGCLTDHKTLGMIKETEFACLKYDVFISHCENDQRSGYDITNIIESRGYKVFLPDRDINIGMLLTQATSEAIISSRKFLVVLTQDYIDSGMTNRFEFQLILRKVLKKTSDHKNLLLIKRDGSVIPKSLETMCTIDWIDGDNAERKCRLLEHWLEGRVSPCGICDCDQTAVEKWFQIACYHFTRAATKIISFTARN